MSNELSEEALSGIRWVLGSLVAAFWSVIIWIFRNQIQKNHDEHEILRGDHRQLNERLESGFDDFDVRMREVEVNIATRQDIEKIYTRLDKWQEDRVTRGDLEYQNKLFDSFKKDVLAALHKRR